MCWLAGNGSLYTRASNTTHHTSGGLPAFSPANSGRSSTEKIIHFAEYAGANLSTPLTNANRTELAHDGTSQVTGGDDKAHIGFVNVSNVELLGFVLNHANGAFGIDEGAVLVYGPSSQVTNCAVRWCYIDGVGRSGDYNETDFSNPSAVWGDHGLNFEFTDNYVTNFIFSGSNSRNVAGITCYGMVNGLFKNNRFSNVYNAIYIKGIVGGDANIVTAELNIFENCPNGFFVQEVNSNTSTPTYIRRNLFTGSSEAGINFATAGVTPTPNIRIYNNTIIANAGSGFVACIDSLDAANMGADCWIHDNVLAVLSGSNRDHIDVSGSTATFARLRNNLYWNGTAGSIRCQWNGSAQTTLANWQSMLQTGGNPANSRDENSSVADPDFVSTTTGVLNVGSPALTMGSSEGIGGSGGQIGCHAGSPTIGPRA